MTGDGDWAESVFTDTELAKLRRAAKAIIDTHNPDMFLPETDEYLEYELSIRREYVHEILGWCRELHAQNDVPPFVSDLLFAIGMAVGVSYLTDDSWEFDEVLSDHATYFGSRDWFTENMEWDDDDDG
jgi:hypothetical protein